MSPPKPRRVYGYARVSSAEQAIGTSLADQQDAIRAHARSLGVKVDRMFVEAESAIHEKIERRDQIRGLLAEVQRGDLVLVDKLDRWSRDPEFTYRSIREILGAGARFFAVGDQCDPSTPEGDTMLGFRVLFAREEHKRIKLRMVGTRRTLRDRGVYAEGRTPFGYRRRGGKGPEKNVLEVDEERAAVVRRVFRLCLDGRAIVRIAELVGLTAERVHLILHTRTYLGEIRNTAGEWMPGTHPAIVDAHTFHAAAEALRERRTRPSVAGNGETADWWLREVARCGLCGARMSASIAGTKEARRYYYVCAHRCERPARRVPVREAEAACAPLVVARLAELRDELARPPVARRAPVDLEERRENLQRRRARLLDAYTDGLVTREDLRARMVRLDEERERLEALAAAPAPASPVQRHAALSSVRVLARAWGRSKPAARREIVSLLAVRVLLARGAAPRFDWKSPEILALAEEV